MEKYNSYLPAGMLLKVLENEQEKIAYYEKLHPMTADHEFAEILQGVLQEEKKHLAIFFDMFLKLFGEMPQLDGDMTPVIISFVEGVRRSIITEIDTFELYNKIYIYESNEEIRTIFGRVMLEEDAHALKLNYIYQKMTENKKNGSS